MPRPGSRSRSARAASGGFGRLSCLQVGREVDALAPEPIRDPRPKDTPDLKLLAGQRPGDEADLELVEGDSLHAQRYEQRDDRKPAALLIFAACT